ncbi:MAG: AAA family ATPase [Clostridia bacterium]|nr:AAA family ATPase [Clostridia bacterium]
MKLVFIIGSGAVGKMTVGQELAKITGLRLFHNHMMIEPVIEIFGGFNGKVITELRDVIFREFAASDREGMIFTFMWAFDQRADWDYVAHVRGIFAEHGAEEYCVELVAPQEIRLQRNATENRLHHKASKRDLEFSDRMLRSEENYRLVSNPDEVPFEHYLRIDNSDMPAEEAARLIRDTFDL